jgi:hypothetical protein
LKTHLPREGGILTLWFSGTAIGLSFLVEQSDLLVAVLYLAGSLSFLISVETVEEFIRIRRGREETRVRLLVPPVLGLILWGPALRGDAFAILALYLAVLAFVGFRVIERKEREWQTRVAFTGAVLLMALLGLFLSGRSLSAPLVAAVFVVPFAFFSGQELFVQAIAEAQRLSGVDSVHLSFRRVPRSRRTVLYSFLGLYAIASAATALLTHSTAFPAAFELFLISFPVVWLSSGRRVSFRRLGFEQATLDGLMTVAVIVFAAIY